MRLFAHGSRPFCLLPSATTVPGDRALQLEVQDRDGQPIECPAQLIARLPVEVAKRRTGGRRQPVRRRRRRGHRLQVEQVRDQTEVVTCPKRDILIAFDLLLVLVTGLLLYAVSARDPERPPDVFDRLQVLLVVSALLVDALALAAIAARITEFGFTPNRVAALGENIVLLVNLAWSAWLYARFLRRRGEFAALERWQMAYLPVYSVWAALVVVVFPPLFGFA